MEGLNILVTVHDGYGVKVEAFRDYFELAEFMAGGCTKRTGLYNIRSSLRRIVWRAT
jgi:hypothetical protein